MTSGLTYELQADDAGKFFRATSRATDEAEQALNANSSTIGPVTAPIIYDELVLGTPTVTGEAVVGYTVQCSEPTVSGGSGEYEFVYEWKASNGGTTFASGSEVVVPPGVVGLSGYCEVTVVDATADKTASQKSNSLGPINRPVLGEFDTWVDSELYDDPSKQIGVLPNGSVICEVRMQPVTNPPLDITYQWSIRNGTGRLSGDENDKAIIYLAPDAAPAGAQVQCKVESRDANDNASAAEITILVSEEETEP